MISRVLGLAAICMLTGCATGPGVTTTSTGLRYQILRTGGGAVATPGQSVTIHETTTLASGTLLFSSRANDTPITFVLGGNQVIAGVDEGVTGMRVGERRLLMVPPSLSRRSSYPPNTPPDSILHIDIELIGVDGN